MTKQINASVEVREIGENTYIVEGSMTLNDFNEHFDTELESDDVDTIAGYYLTGVEQFPLKKLRNITKLLTRTNVLNLLTIRLRMVA